ncbi:MAG: fimbrillin family protein [Prevotella sp.]|nr:fimbrillin family protein [Prevotella sp.]
MGNRLPLHILSAATVLLFAATACTQDDLGGGTLPEGEYPLVIRATGLQAVAAPASRATVDGDWQGVQTVALSVGGTVKEYDVTASDADGYKTAILSSDTDPFWWTSREDITVSAWWPYGTTMPDVVVKEDQSTKEGFEGSDFISAEAQTVQFDNPTLEFSHRTARITVHLKPGAGIPSVTGANVSVTGLGTDNGNPATIRTYAPGTDTYEALTAPQTVKANTPFIQVDLGRGTYYFRPKNDVVLEAGSHYTYTVNVNATGLTLEGCTIGGWTDGGSESGTAEDLGYFIQDDGSYTVYTANGLLAWNEAVQTDPTINCTLTADINLTGKEWTPIGDNDNRYTGTFDGGNYTITGLTVNQEGTNYVGLIGFIGSDGTVKNVKLENVNITGSYYVGGVVGYNSGSVTACTSSGSVSGSIYVGGVVGDNYGTVTACTASGSVEGRSNVGGVVGYNSSGSVTACTSSGSVEGSIDVGGVVGDNYGSVTACYWSDYAGNGIGSGNGGETTLVDGTDVTWADAVDAMNAALQNAGSEWRYELTGELPTLKKEE